MKKGPDIVSHGKNLLYSLIVVSGTDIKSAIVL